MLRVVVVICLWGVSTGHPLDAQDRVTFRLDSGEARAVLVGEVIDSTGRELKILPLQGSYRTLNAEDVIGIETQYVEPHRKAREEFLAGRTDAAQRLFEEAVRQESRDWVDREILAGLVRCAHRTDDLTLAVYYFREIAKHDPWTRDWGIAPLVWVPTHVSDSLQTRARQWLVGASEPDRMLAASLLLLHPTYGKAARSEMNNLASSVNPQISGLAKCQLWRSAQAEGIVSELALESWKSQIARLPRELRGGPSYLVGHGFALRQEHQRAAAELLWVPIVYADHETVSARATLEAAESLERTGLLREADNLYRELFARYPWSPAAQFARSQVGVNRTGSAPQ